MFHSVRKFCKITRRTGKRAGTRLRDLALKYGCLAVQTPEDVDYKAGTKDADYEIPEASDKNNLDTLPSARGARRSALQQVDSQHTIHDSLASLPTFEAEHDPSSAGTQPGSLQTDQAAVANTQEQEIDSPLAARLHSVASLTEERVSVTLVPVEGKGEPVTVTVELLVCKPNGSTPVPESNFDKLKETQGEAELTCPWQAAPDTALDAVTPTASGQPATATYPSESPPWCPTGEDPATLAWVTKPAGDCFAPSLTVVETCESEASQVNTPEEQLDGDFLDCSSAAGYAALGHRPLHILVTCNSDMYSTTEFPTPTADLDSPMSVYSWATGSPGYRHISRIPLPPQSLLVPPSASASPTKLPSCPVDFKSGSFSLPASSRGPAASPVPPSPYKVLKRAQLNMVGSSASSLTMGPASRATATSPSARQPPSYAEMLKEGSRIPRCPKSFSTCPPVSPMSCHGSRIPMPPSVDSVTIARSGSGVPCAFSNCRTLGADMQMEREVQRGMPHVQAI